MSRFQLLTGDALNTLRALKSNSVQCVVTSPPYYLLRYYGTHHQIWGGSKDCDHVWGPQIPGNSRGGSGPNSKSKRKNEDKSSYGRDMPRGKFCQLCDAWCGELGSEPDPSLFVDHLVEICREIKRVLRPDGTFFLNIADTYVSEQYPNHPWGLKQKDLYGIPHRLVEALQKDGWYRRNDAVWSKAGGNCPRCHHRIEKGSTKPEATRDRFTRSSEYVFVMAKSKLYFFDTESVKEPFSSANRRDVFYIPSASFSGAHHAVMPITLAELCVKAGTSEGGACANCAAPLARIVQKGEADKEAQLRAGANKDGSYSGKSKKNYAEHLAEDPSALKTRILEGMKKKETVGWKKTCKCDTEDTVPCVVLDPFSGSGTTGEAALNLGRRYIGIELVEECNKNLATPRLSAAELRVSSDKEISYLPTDSGVYLGSAELLLQRIRPETVRLLLTDPPYNVSRANNLKTMGRTGINFDWDGEFDQEKWLYLADKTIMPGGSIVVWNDWKNLGLVAEILSDLGYDIKRNLTWIKSNPFPRNITRVPVQRVETGLWAVKPGAPWVFNPNRARPYEDLIFNLPIPRAVEGRPRHECKKPDALFGELISIFSDPDDLILDPFSGGGTTAYAAERLGRRHISFEKSEKWYCESMAHWNDARLKANDNGN